jgi:hypothetical protein
LKPGDPCPACGHLLEERIEPTKSKPPAKPTKSKPPAKQKTTTAQPGDDLYDLGIRALRATLRQRYDISPTTTAWRRIGQMTRAELLRELL